MNKGPKAGGTLSWLTRASRRECLPLAFLAFLLALIPPAFGYYYTGFDSVQFDYAYLSEMRRVLLSQEPPWISRLLADEPLFGNPPFALGYPVFWLAALMPSVEWGYSLSVAFHFAVLAAGGALLFRTLGGPRRWSAWAGIVLCLGGSSLDLIRHGQVFLSSCWLPFAWAMLRVGLRRGFCPRTWWGLIVGGCSPLLTGEAQAFCVLAGIVILETCLHLWRHPIKTRAWVALTAVPTSLAISWFHWGVAFKHLENSFRSGSLSLSEANTWNHSGLSVIAQVIPGILKVPVLENIDLWGWQLRNWNLVPTSTQRFPWNYSPYIGWVIFSLFIAACRLRSRKHIPFILMAAGCFVLALGDSTPVFEWARTLIPGVNRFRYPEKYLLYSHWATLALATACAMRVLRNSGARRTFALLIGAGALASVLGSIGALMESASLDAWIRRSAKPPIWGGNLEVFAVGRELAARLLWAGALAALAGIALMRGSFRRKWTDARWRKLIPILIAAELVLNLPFAVELAPSVVNRATPWFASILTQDSTLCSTERSLGLVSANGSWRDAMSNYHLGINMLSQGAPGSAAIYGIRQGMRYSQLYSAPYRSAFESASRAQTTGLLSLGCTHVVSLDVEDLGQATQGLQEIPNPAPDAIGGQFRLWKIIAATPQAFELLEAGISTAKVIESSRPSGHQLHLRIAAGGKSVVGTHIQYAPGWSATVRAPNGQPSEIPLMTLRGTLLGAEVPASQIERWVDFEYHPPGLARAALISVLGILLASWMSLKLGSKRKQTK